MNFVFAREVKKLIMGGVYLPFLFFIKLERGGGVVNVSNFIASHLPLKSVSLKKEKPKQETLPLNQ